MVENFLVQAGDLEFGKKENINYTYIGSGRSKYDLIKPETDQPFEFKKGTIAFAKSKNGDTEDSEFLILLDDAFLFEGEYTPLGRVISGITALEKIYNSKGFVSEYAKSTISEDMAETFSLMMSDNYLILDMISKDEILNKKVKLIENIVKKLDANHLF